MYNGLQITYLSIKLYKINSVCKIVSRILLVSTMLLILITYLCPVASNTRFNTTKELFQYLIHQYYLLTYLCIDVYNISYVYTCSSIDHIMI